MQHEPDVSHLGPLVIGEKAFKEQQVRAVTRQNDLGPLVTGIPSRDPDVQKTTGMYPKGGKTKAPPTRNEKGHFVRTTASA